MRPGSRKFREVLKKTLSTGCYWRLVCQTGYRRKWGGEVHRDPLEKGLGHSKELAFSSEHSGPCVAGKPRTCAVRLGSQKDHSGS